MLYIFAQQSASSTQIIFTEDQHFHLISSWLSSQSSDHSQYRKKQYQYEIIAGSYVVSLCSEDSSNWQFFHYNPLITSNTNKTTSLWNHCCFTFYLKITHSLWFSDKFQFSDHFQNWKYNIIIKPLLIYMYLFPNQFLLNPRSL